MVVVDINHMTSFHSQFIDGMVYNSVLYFIRYRHSFSSVLHYNNAIIMSRKS